MNDLVILETDDMLYYNNAREPTMSDHHHHGHHHHHAGHAHPPARAHQSILRMSALERLGFAAGLIALLWVAAYWAMR